MKWSYTVFDKDTGEALKDGSASQNVIRKMKANAPANEYWALGVGQLAQTHFYDSTIELDPESNDPEDVRIQACTDSGITFSATTSIPGGTINVDNIPTGSNIKIDGVTYTIQDGFLDLTFQSSGEYHVYMNDPPYLPIDMIITVAPEET